MQSPSGNRIYYVILFIAFIASVLLRLPNLNRPISKHHEFNTAVILNGTLSWKEAGGAAPFSYTPLMTYPGEANRLLQRGPFTDDSGNQVYLSLGPGWYVLPYGVFTVFHLPFNVLSLQILNLFIHLCTLLALYRLGNVLVKRYAHISPRFPLFACLVFLFMPGPLWYFGNGYVHAAISLPAALLVFTQYLQWYWGQKKFNIKSSVAFAVAGMAGIYLDWFTFFLLAVLATHALFLFILKRKLCWLKIALLSGIVAIAAVALIFYQFVSFLGVQKVVDYWTSRASDRSFTTGEVSVLQRFTSVLVNLATCTGIAVVSIPVVLFILRKKSIPVLPVLLWGITCVCYNGVFFNWSSEHEFSMVPVSIVIGLLSACCILQLFYYRRMGIVLTLLCTLNVLQYYFINPPGKTSRSGDPYNQHQLLGQAIRRRIPSDCRIFSNLNNDPMVEYYAHRSFVLNKAATAAQARHICDSLHVPKAVWLRIDSLQIKERTDLTPGPSPRL